MLSRRYTYRGDPDPRRMALGPRGAFDADIDSMEAQT
jgi:hypothetical protein